MRRHRAFTLVELLVVMAVIMLLVSILTPNLVQVRRRARLIRCATNVKAILTGFSLYAEDPINSGTWPWMNGTGWDSPTGTNWQKAPPVDDDQGDARAITALPFLLVRQGDASPAHFKCPADEDVRIAPNVDPQNQYDFEGPQYVSYSYAAPLAAPDGRWLNGCKPTVRQADRVAVLTDKNPAMAAAAVGPWQDVLSDSQRREFLSRNHDGDAIVIGYLSYHVGIEQRADIGVQYDNIYTAGGSTRSTWRGATDVNLKNHTDAEDSFTVGPYGTKK